MPAVIVDETISTITEDTTAQRDTTLPDETPPAPPAPPPAPTIPEKFRGKTVEELIASQIELEKVLGRQGQELGTLRESHDKYLVTALEAAQRQPATSNKQDESNDDVDYFVNPKAAIDKAVENHPLVKELKEKQGLTQQERAKAAFVAKHPDHEQIMEDPAFADWVRASPARLRRMAEADRYNFEAADDLFGTYKEIKAARTTASPPPPADDSAAKAAKAAALLAGKVPSGNASPQGAPVGKQYRRSDLMRLRNTDPERYEAMGPEILLAYKEKRVING